MLARFRKATDEREDGFTLIELLVVMIIIGILAAIAIPVFLNQRKSGYDSAAKSDVHNAALAEESNFTDNQTYIAASAAGVIGGFTKSANTTTLAVTGNIEQASGAMGTMSTTLGADTSYEVAAMSKSGKWFCYDSSQSGKGVYTLTTTANNSALAAATC